MASEMTSAFREFALKKLNEAKQRGATLATVATASISSNVNVAVPATATSFVFRSNATRQHEKEPLALDRKLSVLRETNAALKKTASDHATETLDDAVSKIDLVNESLAYSIENVQECSHVLKMLHRQLRDLGTLRNANDLHFYRRNDDASAPLSSDSNGNRDAVADARGAAKAPLTSAERFAVVDGADYDY